MVSFRVARNPSRTNAQRGDHFLQVAVSKARNPAVLVSAFLPIRASDTALGLIVSNRPDLDNFWFANHPENNQVVSLTEFPSARQHAIVLSAIPSQVLPTGLHISGVPIASVPVFVAYQVSEMSRSSNLMLRVSRIPPHFVSLLPVPWRRVSQSRIPKDLAHGRIFRHNSISLMWFSDFVVRRTTDKGAKENRNGSR